MAMAAVVEGGPRRLNGIPGIANSRNAVLEVGGVPRRHVETPDFDLSDPWSRHMRSVLERVSLTGRFSGQSYFEAGIGDARNLMATGIDIAARKGRARVIGVDIDADRLAVAEHNLRGVSIPRSSYELHQGDVVTYLQKRNGENPLTGIGVACLPQAPAGETLNHADGIDSGLLFSEKIHGMEVGGHSVEQLGLTLNTAFLDELRGQVDSNNFRLFLILSGRIPEDARRDMFSQTGWHIINEHTTQEPIRQDPDTGVSFTQAFDNGNLFYEAQVGGYSAISASEAERRRAESMRTGGDLNVYHHLTVYEVSPSVKQEVVYRS